MAYTLSASLKASQEGFSPCLKALGSCPYLSKTLSGSWERLAVEAKGWEMRGRAMCLEGRIQRQEGFWANLPTGPYDKGARRRSLDK